MAEKTVDTIESAAQDLEQLCEAVPAAVERTAAKLEERYFTRLAEEADRSCESSGRLEAEVRCELETLRRSAKYLSAAHQRAAALEDELGARLKDMRTSRGRNGF